MTTITWVLAADGCRARIFETHGLTLDAVFPALLSVAPK